MIERAAAREWMKKRYPTPFSGRMEMTLIGKLERFRAMLSAIALCNLALVCGCAVLGGLNPQTRFRRMARGYWSADCRTAGFCFITIDYGKSEGAMKVVWDTGLGCQSEDATIAGNRITVTGDMFPAVITIEDSSVAHIAFRWNGEVTEHSIQLVKTRKDPRMVCD